MVGGCRPAHQRPSNKMIFNKGFEELFFGVAEEDSATAATMLTTLLLVYGAEEVFCAKFLDPIKQG
jgi:hypothetical protein